MVAGIILSASNIPQEIVECRDWVPRRHGSQTIHKILGT